MGDDVDYSSPGSGVWEKSANSKWITVAEKSHKIPRRARIRSEGSVDPSLGIHSFVNSFELEIPADGTNSVFISDGASLVRLDSVADATDNIDEPGPSTSSRVSVTSRRRSDHISSPNREEQPEDVESEQQTSTPIRSRRSRRRKRKKLQIVSDKERRIRRPVCISADSSPGRDSPSPESLTRIILNHSSTKSKYS